VNSCDKVEKSKVEDIKEANKETVSLEQEQVEMNQTKTIGKE
jgi:hypothetical protein